MNRPTQTLLFGPAAPYPATVDAWRAPIELPELGAYDEITLDCESTGLDAHGADLPVGIGICTLPDKKRFYLPFGHRGGGNLDENVVRRWAKTELRDKHVYNLNIKIESHWLHQWGVDLEAQGCELHEVQHAAALLDEHRRSFSLENLARDYLGRGKKELPKNVSIADLPASVVGPYNEEDTLLAAELKEKFDPLIDGQDLRRVLDLEDSLLHCTCAMERQGVRVDEEKLDHWLDETRARYEEIIVKELYRETGMRVDPDSPQSMLRLYDKLGLPYGLTPKGNPSFTKAALAANDHPVVRLAFEARQVQDLRTNFLIKYKRLARDGRLYYNLHQLRNDEYGTITGRYASSNINVQQVPKPGKQPPSTRRWLVRELFLPEPGARWLSSDASQIEFRLFAHYSRSERLIRAYRENPDVDFHDLVTRIIRQLIPDYERVFAKNFNFMKLYGGGIDKAAGMLGKARDEVEPLVTAYDQEFPEVRRLGNYVSRVAERRGYVKTYLGRRGRYVKGVDERYYSALNKVLQGTAADVLKVKLLDVYRRRRELGIILFFTVHDEIDGSVEDDAAVRRVDAQLNEQALPFRVPLTWDTSAAENWRGGWKPKE